MHKIQSLMRLKSDQYILDTDSPLMFDQTFDFAVYKRWCWEWLCRVLSHLPYEPTSPRVLQLCSQSQRRLRGHVFDLVPVDCHIEGHRKSANLRRTHVVHGRRTPCKPSRRDCSPYTCLLLQPKPRSTILPASCRGIGLRSLRSNVNLVRSSGHFGYWRA